MRDCTCSGLLDVKVVRCAPKVGFPSSRLGCYMRMQTHHPRMHPMISLYTTREDTHTANIPPLTVRGNGAECAHPAIATHSVSTTTTQFQNFISIQGTATTTHCLSCHPPAQTLVGKRDATMFERVASTRMQREGRKTAILSSISRSSLAPSTFSLLLVAPFCPRVVSVALGERTGILGVVHSNGERVNACGKKDGWRTKVFSLIPSYLH